MNEADQATVECSYCSGLMPDRGPSAHQWCSDQCKGDWSDNDDLTSRGLDKSTWDRWGGDSRDLFDNVLEAMTSMGWDVIKHPDAPEVEYSHYKTIAHNAAYTAADELYHMARRSPRG